MIAISRVLRPNSHLYDGHSGFSEDGTPFDSAAIGLIRGLAFDPAGNLVFSEVDPARARRVDKSSNRITTLAGIGPLYFREGGPALAAAFQTPTIDLVILLSGELLIADYDRMFKLDGSRRLIRIAGKGYAGPLEGVPALGASIKPPSASPAMGRSTLA